MYPNEENVFIVANLKKNGDYYENPTFSHLTKVIWFWGKWWKEKLLLPIQSFNIMCPNMESMIVVPIIKKIVIIMSIHVYPFWQMNFDYKENGGKRGFSFKTKASILFIWIRRICLWCQMMNVMEIITSIRICLFWHIKFDVMEN